MEPDSDRDHQSRGRRRRDDDRDDGPERKRAHRNDDDSSGMPKRRERSGERDGRRRSATPDARRRRSRERDQPEDSRRRNRDRDRDREGRKDDETTDHRHGDQGEEDEEILDSGRGKSRRRQRKRQRRPADKNNTYSEDEGHDSRQQQSAAGPVRRKGPLPSQDDTFTIAKGGVPEKPKEKPNFGTTGLLAAASNAVAQADGTTITLKYHEPPEARKPPGRDRWALFVFKGGDIVDTVELGARSCWLIGRETAVVDLLAEHPSISKQHAVLQFRYTEKRDEFGDKIGRVKPYLIDLESANGTTLNGNKIPKSRYLELRDKDMIQLGLSTREYVLMLAPRE